MPMRSCSGLHPQPFRRRYAAEMSLDFEDALGAARAGGWVAVGAFAMRRCRFGR